MEKSIHFLCMDFNKMRNNYVLIGIKIYVISQQGMYKYFFNSLYFMKI
jgi:hypothetical protein